MITRDEVRRLSHVQCEYLMEHIDCCRPMLMTNNEPATRRRMLELEYIRHEPPNAIAPRGCVLTQLGREMVCAIGDMWIEAMRRAEFESRARWAYGLIGEQE